LLGHPALIQRPFTKPSKSDFLHEHLVFHLVTTQVDRLKAEGCQGKAYFEAMFGAKLTFRQSTAIVLL